jgi:GntR family transcriptional regulator, transcriptional repressor for pyruvate dehydrogenase complex
MAGGNTTSQESHSMQEILMPIKTESLKDVFVSRFEEFILSGKLSIGQKLPSERELALQLGVSRPIVHEGLVDLAAKGLVTIKPRVGTIINDYRKQGSLAILSSLINYHDGFIEPKLLDSMLEMRLLFEVEAARLAALRRTDDHMEAFKGILEKEEKASRAKIEKVVGLDFEFHHLVSIASGNVVYPLLINSFSQVYTNLSRQFFSDKKLIPHVFRFHGEMVEA